GGRRDHGPTPAQRRAARGAPGQRAAALLHHRSLHRLPGGPHPPAPDRPGPHRRAPGDRLARERARDPRPRAALRLCCGRIHHGAIVLLLAASAAAAPTPADGTFRELRWRPIGPMRGGRSKAAAVVPGKPGTFLVGVCNGGILRTTDYGRTWQPIFD